MDEWWRDPRCHFGTLEVSDPLLTDRTRLAEAIGFVIDRLKLEEGSRVLDLCCGPGRYVVELARSGLDVVGIDINNDYVDLARRLIDQAGVCGEIRVGDMREVPYANSFDAVINVGTSFGFFESESDDQAALQSVRNALKPGGRCLLEMGNRDYLLKNFAASASIENSDDTITKVARHFDYTRSRINSRFQRFENEKLLEQWTHSWRAYSLAELVKLLDQAQLDFVSVFGGWKSQEYDVDAPRMVIVSERHAT